MKDPTDMSVIASPDILFDIDNTLLDNDQVERDLRAYLTERFGTSSADRY